MDSVNPSHSYDPNSYPRIQNTPAVVKTSAHLNIKEVSPQAVTKVEKVETFAKLFDDNELERLQQNLESIASMAETALKQVRQSN